MKIFSVDKKITKKGFYCPSDTIYFNIWTKLFILSAKKHAPWAHIHVHIFDAVPNDILWCNANNVTVTIEQTPEEYTQSIERKKDFWVNIRFIRLSEIYDDAVSVIAIDSDSLFKNDLTEKEFDNDLQSSWVTVRGEDNSSLGSAVGFGPDDFRHKYKNKLLEHEGHFRWFLDQQVLDNMLRTNQVASMNLKYSDFTSQDSSVIWTGKGKRKFKKKFASLAELYRNINKGI
jgi:hypothetical protein